MSITVELDPSGSQAVITFTLAEEAQAPASVVGSFNDWDPTRNPLLAKEDGTRGTTVTVDATQDLYFRYLGSGGIWFDDLDADEVTPEGSVIRLSKRERTADPDATGLETGG